MRTLLNLLLVIFTISCGTTHHFAPISPVSNTNMEGRLTISYSLSDFNSIVAQLGFYFKIRENDMIGFSLQNFVLPSNLSYVRFWEQDNQEGNFQFHINNLLTRNYSPTYEIRTALLNNKDNIKQSIEFGLGVYSTPFVFNFLGENIPTLFSPIIAYQYRSDSFIAQAQYIHNFSKYRTKDILIYRYNEFDYINNEWFDKSSELIYEPYEIIQFYTDSTAISRWIIQTSEKDSLIISKYDPYVDCWACRLKRSELLATIPTSDYDVYWISDRNEYIVLRNLQLALLNFETKGVVNLKPGKEYINESLRKNRIIDDISISIGTLMRNQ